MNNSEFLTRIFPILIDLQQSWRAFSMASPDLTMDTPQLPFWYFSPLYTQPGNKEENISEGCASYMINSHTALTSSSISEGVAVAEWSKVLLKREKINENQKDPRSATRPGQS